MSLLSRGRIASWGFVLATLFVVGVIRAVAWPYWLANVAVEIVLLWAGVDTAGTIPVTRRPFPGRPTGSCSQVPVAPDGLVASRERKSSLRVGGQLADRYMLVQANGCRPSAHSDKRQQHARPDQHRLHSEGRSQGGHQRQGEHRGHLIVVLHRPSDAADERFR